MCQRARQTEGLVQWVDRFVIERDESHPKSIGQDIGMTRCALDPSKDFAEKVLAQTKTALITSASLTPLRPTDSDKQEDNYDWVTWRTGAKHLPQQAKFIYAPSPFDYTTQAKMLVITDIEKNNRAKAEAMAALFCASKGGGARALDFYSPPQASARAYRAQAERARATAFGAASWARACDPD